jgi:VWFA-related protein
MTKILPLYLGVCCTAGLTSLRAAEDPPLFHVSTQLVEVDVAVRGKNGQVRDLTKNDFAVLDNGKPQQISLFSVRSSAGRDSRPSPLPGSVISNRPTRLGEEPFSPTVILWDALNTETSDQAWVRSQVIKYLQTMRPGDPVAVYLLVKNLHVIQDFTDDRLSLMQAVRRTNAEQSTDLSAPDLTNLQSQISLQLPQLADLQTKAIAAAGEMTDYALRDQVYTTQAALEAIAEHLSGLPGRKKLAWISGSFPAITPTQRTHVGETQVEVLDFSPQIAHAIRALNGANVAVYPIDPRGVTSGAMPASAPRSASGPSAANAGSQLAPASLTAPGIDTMNLLASGTGGRAFYGTNDATGAIKAIMEDGEVTYRLGFYPTDEKMDGTYHSLSVKVMGKGTQHIADFGARKGYFALDAKNAVNGHWRERLTESMQNPLEATQLGLRASVSPAKGESGIYNLDITLDFEGLHLEHDQNGRWSAAIAFGTLFSPSESTKGTLETIRLSLTEDRLRAALENGYVLRRKVDVGDRTGSLRVVIEDAATGTIGSVSVPFVSPSIVAPSK